jgi:hypothetical protein
MEAMLFVPGTLGWTEVEKELRYFAHIKENGGSMELGNGYKIEFTKEVE